MRWATFILGIVFLLVGLFTGILGFLVFGIIGVILIIWGSKESETEKLQKTVLRKHLDRMNRQRPRKRKPKKKK